MTKYGVSFAAAAFLTACSGPGKSDIVNACVEQGETRETCQCFADAAQDELRPDTFTKVASAARSGDFDKAGEDLSTAEQFEFAAFALKAVVTCDGSDG